MEYGNHKKHSAGARNVKARAKRALLLPSSFINFDILEDCINFPKYNSKIYDFFQSFL